MAKRHNWSRGKSWCVCDDCGCRYKTGNITREYEQPDGRRTVAAEECMPRCKRSCGWWGEGRGQCTLQEGHSGEHEYAERLSLG